MNGIKEKEMNNQTPNQEPGKLAPKPTKGEVRHVSTYKKPPPQKPVVAPVEFDLEGHKNIVDYVIQTRYRGSLTDMAQELTLVSGNYVTRQKIDGWKVRGQFPVDWIETVFGLTRLPLRALLMRTMRR